MFSPINCKFAQTVKTASQMAFLPVGLGGENFTKVLEGKFPSID